MLLFPCPTLLLLPTLYQHYSLLNTLHDLKQLKKYGRKLTQTEDNGHFSDILVN